MLLRHVADAADIIVDADDIALRAAAVRELGGIAGFGIAALGAGTMNVDKLVVAGIGCRVRTAGRLRRAARSEAAGLSGRTAAVRWSARHGAGRHPAGRAAKATYIAAPPPMNPRVRGADQ